MKGKPSNMPPHGGMTRVIITHAVKHGRGLTQNMSPETVARLTRKP